MRPVVFLVPFLFVVSGLLAVPEPPGPAAAAFAIEVIPPLPGDLFTVPWGINNLGHVVGWSSDGGRARPFLFTDAGGTMALPTLADRPNGSARDISDAGFIVGSVWAGYLDQPGHAVRWVDGVVQDLGVLGSGPTSESWGVNTTGAVTGASETGYSQGRHGFLFSDPSGMVDLTPSNGIGQGMDVNDLGQVTGYATMAGGYRAFLWADGVLRSLGTAGGYAHSYGFAINERGQVAGNLRSAAGNSERLFRYTDGVGMEILGGAGQQNTAFGINGRGDVVGEGRVGGGIIRAMLYTDTSGLIDFDNLIDPGLYLRFLSARDINDARQVVGSAWDNIVGKSVGVRLTLVGALPANDTPGAPVLRGARTEGLSVHVEWTLSPDDGAGDNDVIGYEIWIGTTFDPLGRGYTHAVTVPQGVGAFEHGGGNATTSTYFYRIVAVDAQDFRTAAADQGVKLSRFLPAGVHLVSVPVEVADWRTESVLAGVPWVRVRTYEAYADRWHTNDRGSGLSDVKILDRSMGMWLLTGADAWWTIAGVVPRATQVALRSGWNLIGYPSFVSRSVSEAFAAAAYLAVEGFADVPPYYLRSMAGADSLEPGGAYWILAAQDAVVVFEN